MAIVFAFVLFAIIWVLSLLVALPIGTRSQAESGEVVPGTSESAPEFANLRKKLKWVTIVTVILWAIVLWLVFTDALTVRDIDFFHRMTPLQS